MRGIQCVKWKVLWGKNKWPKEGRACRLQRVESTCLVEEEARIKWWRQSSWK